MKKLILALLLPVFALLGQDLSGNWTLKTQAGDRGGAMQLALTQRGNALSGKITGPRREYPIQKGSVDSAGKIDILLGGNKGALAGARITGAVEGEHLRLTIQTKRGEAEATASRSQ